MALDPYALLTVEEYKALAGLSNNDIEADAISLYSDDGTTATAKKSGNILTLDKTAGTGTDHAIDLTGGTPVVVTDITLGICTTADTQDLNIGDLVIFAGDVSVSGKTYKITALTLDTDFTIDDLTVNPGAVIATTCILASYNLGKLAVLINNYVGWTANLEGWSMASSIDLKNLSVTNCLLVVNELTLIYYDNYILERLIDSASQIVENFLRRKILSRTYKNERYSGHGSVYLELDNYPITAISQICEGKADVIRVKYTSTTERNAYITVTATGIILTVDGTSQPELTFVAYPTIVTMAVAINAVASWSAQVISSVFNGYPSNQLFEQMNLYAKDVYADLCLPDDPLDGYEVDKEEGRIYRPSGFSSGDRNIFVSYTGGYAVIPDAIRHGVFRLVQKLDEKREESGGESLKSEKMGDYSYTTGTAENLLKKVLSATEYSELKAYQRPLVGDLY